MLTYELKDVSLVLGRRRVFTGLDLRCDGRVIGLLGPNGAGKTSLMRMLATILRPTRGQILLHGRDIVREPAYARPRIGYVPQHFRPPGDLTGRQVLRYLGALRSVSGSDRIDQCLAQTGLVRAADQATGAYSGGMLRRLALAQALLTEPAVLLMDEPTAGLDPEEQDRFRTLVRGLAEGGCQVLISTHLLEEVSALADSVVVLYEGRILFAGLAAELLARTGTHRLQDAYLRLLRDPGPQGMEARA
ncbi:ABC-2 type transport system ATP-binding protein [Symbiobacterium terraclitae]|uniref:ABC-2 type transport system ATP-binding protein n=1 Tax=Symbiobacterium terraclitae TaxID=557451 RepID=A0ABS4JTA7_9FIRM|nr:ATP-binding cassette domain-containing protein [Symbiobacterium terraclitae]MBP2018776.1 ABC-2 type transport system ATP-binding protein [Symbiobacterium terraclitae]